MAQGQQHLRQYVHGNQRRDGRRRSGLQRQFFLWAHPTTVAAAFARALPGPCRYRCRRLSNVLAGSAPANCAGCPPSRAFPSPDAAAARSSRVTAAPQGSTDAPTSSVPSRRRTNTGVIGNRRLKPRFSALHLLLQVRRVHEKKSRRHDEKVPCTRVGATKHGSGEVYGGLDSQTGRAIVWRRQKGNAKEEVQENHETVHADGERLSRRERTQSRRNTAGKETYVGHRAVNFGVGTRWRQIGSHGRACSRVGRMVLGRQGRAAVFAARDREGLPERYFERLFRVASDAKCTKRTKFGDLHQGHLIINRH